MLPENDKDLKLARRIGKLLDNKQFKAESLNQDEFELMLGKFKEAEASRNAENPEHSTAMWNAISAATQPTLTTNQPRAKIFTLRPSMYRWAVAASILITAVIGWLVIQPPSPPTLVAQAQDDIYIHQLEDGSTITLRPHTSLYEQEVSENERSYTMEGEAFFDITHNPQRTFTVEAGVAHVAVLGTSFNVTNRDETVSVYLEEGRIELTHTNSQQQEILSPGQVGILNSQSTINVNEAPDNTEYIDWLSGIIYFQGKSFGEIISELEFHFAVTITLPENLSSQTASGDLPLDSLDAALEKLSIIMGGGRFEQTTPDRYTFELDI